MSWTPSDSSIRLSPELEEAISRASSASEITMIMRDAALSQGLVRRDELAPEVLLETPLASRAPKKFAESVTDPATGKKIIFEGDSELDVTKQMNAYMKEHFSQPPAEAQSARIADQPRDTNGRFVETLHEAASDLQDARLMQSWEQATEEFLSSEDGASWPGGDANKEILGRILIEQNLVDTTDKTAALVAAARFARENDLLVENPDVSAAKNLHSQLAAAKRPEDIRDLLIASRGGASGLFGR